MEVKKYRKKPVIVEAIQYTGDNVDAIVAFAGENCKWGNRIIIPNQLRGSLKAEPGDYIIKGVDGEFYPCAPDVFEATYGPVGRSACLMTFGQALDALQQGKKVAREGWNGRGMFIYFTRGRILTEARDDVPSEVIREKGFCSLNPHIDMKAADDSIVCGWLASQTDMLAEDWVIVE